MRTDKTRTKGGGRKEVSVLYVMKDKELKVEENDVYHTLGTLGGDLVEGQLSN